MTMLALTGSRLSMMLCFLTNRRGYDEKGFRIYQLAKQCRLPVSAVGQGIDAWFALQVKFLTKTRTDSFFLFFSEVVFFFIVVVACRSFDPGMAKRPMGGLRIPGDMFSMI